MRLSKGFPGMTVVVAEDRSMCVQPNQVVRTAWVDTDPCRSASSEKAGRNLYGAFIEQNVNASRILIVESAFDPRNPTRPGERAHPSQDNARLWLSSFLGRFNLHQ